MGTIIENGAGDGKKAKVDSANRLHTHALTETASESASLDGNAYNINTGNITLTSANESSVLYFESETNEDLLITAVGYQLGNSAGGSGDVELSIDKNPTSGTIISGATSVDINENKNTGSNETLDVKAYKGSEGLTALGGTVFYESLLAGAGRSYVISTGNIVIPRGKSIAVKVTPPSGNTSMKVKIFLSIVKYILN